MIHTLVLIINLLCLSSKSLAKSSCEIIYTNVYSHEFSTEYSPLLINSRRVLYSNTNGLRTEARTEVQRKSFQDVHWKHTTEIQANGEIVYFIALIGKDTVTNRFVTFARLSYLLLNAESIELGYITTKYQYRQNGLSKLLYKRMLELNPQVKKMHRHYRDDNLAIFKRALLSHPPPWTQMKIISAIKQTPAYLALQAYGFSEVENILFFANGDDIELSYDITKPHT